VFRDAELDEVIDIARRFNFAAIQLHGGEDSEYITRFKDRMPSCHVFKAVLLGSGAHELDSLPQGADLYVFDGAHPGSGEGFDWGVLKDYRGETPFFLAGGVGVHSVEQVHRCAQVHRQCLGIDLNSKVETRAGVKDLAAVRQVIEGVRR
jgi:phosphoribosylanthranilate isomerase